MIEQYFHSVASFSNYDQPNRLLDLISILDIETPDGSPGFLGRRIRQYRFIENNKAWIQAYI